MLSTSPFIIDIERGVGDTAQGIGEAQGVGETALDDTFSFTESVGEYEGAFSAHDSDGTCVNDCYDEFALDYVGKCVLDPGYRQVDSYLWPAHRLPLGAPCPGF